ncbi:hypothetical protein [Desulfurobacterium crinifex]
MRILLEVIKKETTKYLVEVDEERLRKEIPLSIEPIEAFEKALLKNSLIELEMKGIIKNIQEYSRIVKELKPKEFGGK